MVLHVWAAIHFGLRWFPQSSASYYDHPAMYNNASVSYTSSPDVQADALELVAAMGEFSRYFGHTFRRHWRPPVVIHGIPTTVFNYAGLASEVGQPESDFERSLAALKRVSPNRLQGGDREKAFWINVYNLGAMKLVAENYPVTSITDPKISAGNPWGIPGIQVGDGQYALRQIETEILLKKFDDPRIVFAVSCAAVSCPDRTSDIFSGERIDEQLDEMIRRLLANPKKGLVIDRQRDVVTISWIWKADRKLFGDGSDDALLEFLRRYVSPDTQDWIDTARTKIKIKIDYFEHDWGLNDIALADGDG